MSEHLSMQEEHRDANVAGRRVEWATYRHEDSQPQEQIVLAPGILSGFALYRDFAKDLAGRGQLVTTIKHQAGGPTCQEEVAYMAKRMSDEHDLPVTVFGHSLGGVHAVQAAAHHPDDINRLLLLQPAGFGGVHPERALNGLRRGERRTGLRQLRDDVAIAAEGLSYIRKNPKRVRQVAFAARHNVIAQARDLPEHITRDALLFEDDRLIDTTQVAQGLRIAEIDTHYLEKDQAFHNAQRFSADKVGRQVVEILHWRQEDGAAKVAV